MQNTILSTADISRLFRVTETTVKRWADEGTLKCQKTPGGHRRFEIRNVIEFAERNSFDPSGVLELVGGHKVEPAVQIALMVREYGTLVAELTRRALSPDRDDVHVYLAYLYEHKLALWEICDRVLRPALHEIGEMWARGDIGVNHEHSASYQILDALTQLQSQILLKPATGKTVLLACPGEELHEIGLRCIAHLFEAEGWKIRYLGARTPRAAILSSIAEMRPSVVGLSVSIPANVDNLGEEVREIAVAARAVGGKVVVGGQGATDEIVRPDQCDEVHRSTKDALDFITRMEKNGAKESHPTMHSTAGRKD